MSPTTVAREVGPAPPHATVTGRRLRPPRGPAIGRSYSRGGRPCGRITSFLRGNEFAGLDAEGRRQGGDRPQRDLQFDREGLVACPAGGWMRYIDTMSDDFRPTLAGVVLATQRAAMAVAKDS